MRDREEAESAGVPAPMVWAFVVREALQGPPFAEAIVEIDPALHAVLVRDALESGFTIAAGEPPQTSAAVRVRDGRPTSLVLVGDRNIWAPALSVEVSPRWVSAAEARGGTVLVAVRPWRSARQRSGSSRPAALRVRSTRDSSP